MARGEFAMRERFWPFLVLCSFLGLVFLTGGGARPDIQSLVILRPLAILACGYGLWRFSYDQATQYGFLFSFAVATFAFVGVELIPLPPSMWQALPGRELIAEIDRVAGLGDVWRPVSMVPSATWNAFYSLFVPLGTLLLATGISREDRFLLLPLLIGAGLVSGVLGMLQVVGSPSGPLYLYNVTNGESSVGLFSNRNHQAMMLACLFPMLAVYASSGAKTVEQHRFRTWSAVAAAAVLVPLLLVTGSRAGLILGLAGIVFSFFIYQRPEFDRPAKRKHVKKITLYLAAAFLVVGLGILSVLLSRAQAFERVIAPDKTEELRLIVWGPIANMGMKYFPVGSGIGSFVEVYQIDESLNLLRPTYLNHAHNDWLEVFMTGGLAALLFLAAAAWAWVRTSATAWRAPNAGRRDVLFARMGSVILLLLAVGSVVDYPLRTPSLACLAVIAAIWACRPRSAKELSGKNGGSLEPAPLAR